jgi:hypothetical protein
MTWASNQNIHAKFRLVLADDETVGPTFAIYLTGRGITTPSRFVANPGYPSQETRVRPEIAGDRHAALVCLGVPELVAGDFARNAEEPIGQLQACRHGRAQACPGGRVRCVNDLPVSYWPLTQDEVFEHYERVAGAIDMPICVYNNSWTTGLKGLKPAFDLLDHPVRLLEGLRGRNQASSSGEAGENAGGHISEPKVC